ncbi:C-X-C motif chemokine 16-like [Hyla sarda]|uniref:C-X-C motif chemokine 16-like n=1 Tax=Hyla sarda TaxID=327740 RepID=UPI0024C437E5|nr:C-X-C motif chemokine 16-like [Hyla sarda]XP_056426201.1 C-X-C motif chemokine 16-like [Hyla sarda]XP_056426202.1 C-X-C motif chemokine 16-like [Hyla sarda]
MQAPGSFALFLLFVLELTPRPGYSQQGGGFLKNCPKCIKFLKVEDMTIQIFELLVQKATPKECHTNYIEFQLPRGIICGDKINSWVGEVIKCIDQGRTPCLPTTTQKFPTSSTNTAPPFRLSTQTWTGGTSIPSKTTIEELSTQKYPETTIRLTTTGPDSDQKKDPLHGNGPSSEKDDVKSKMSQMTITIISLLLIVLVMTAAGVYVWCRKGSFPHCKRHCVEETVRYEPTPSEDSIGP